MTVFRFTRSPIQLTLFVLLPILSLVAAPLKAQDMPGPQARVLLSQAADVTNVVVPTSGAVLINLDSNGPLQLEPGTTLTVTPRGKDLEIDWRGQSVRGQSFLLSSESGQLFKVGRNAYAGSLELQIDPRTGTSEITNIVPLEDYVAAVVSAEYGLNDTQGAGAMAIVARTYALAVMEAGRVLRDDERSQVYRGHSSTTPASRKAANDTAGYVLTYDGELIEAVYSSSNGGHTASNTSVWDTPSRPYLAANKDPFDAVSPHSEWQFDVDKKALHDELSRRYGATIQEVRVLDTANDGRVRSVELRAKGAGDRVISGTAFRAALASAYGPKSARSTFFSLDDRGRTYRLDGRGFGHGVGLSQWGAHGRALEGHSHQDILAFYYPGSQLVRLSPGAPSTTVSDPNPITQEKKSTRILDAHSAWGRASDSRTSDSSPDGSARRVGW